MTEPKDIFVELLETQVLEGTVITSFSNPTFYNIKMPPVVIPIVNNMINIEIDKTSSAQAYFVNDLFYISTNVFTGTGSNIKAIIFNHILTLEWRTADTAWTSFTLLDIGPYSDSIMADLVPTSAIIRKDKTINKVLSFVTNITSIYNLSRYSCGCFYVDWDTSIPNHPIIGREQMGEFIRNLNSNNNNFSKIVQIYNKIHILQLQVADYRQRRLVTCCNYEQMIENLKDQLEQYEI